LNGGRESFEGSQTSLIDNNCPVALEAFIAAGLYDPDAPRAQDRRALLEHLLSRGFTAEAIIAASPGRMPTHISGALMRQGPELVSVRTVAERSGLDVDRVAALRLALGFPVADPDTDDVPETLTDDVELFKFGIEHFGEERALALARVIGDSVARIVEATRAAFSASVREASMTELEISQRNELTNAGWVPLAETINHLLKEWSASGYEFFEAILGGDAVLAVAFIDLVESTRWTAAVGPDEHNEALLVFERLAWESAVLNGGRVIKLIGDEAMVVATDPVRATRIAVDVCDRTNDENRLPSARSAVGVGRVTVRGGDVFGPLVNLVARATKEAPPGHVVVTAEVAERLDAGAWRLESVGSRPLRGIESTTDLYVVGVR
jgi:adenylate cyclase